MAQPMASSDGQQPHQGWHEPCACGCGGHFVCFNDPVDD